MPSRLAVSAIDGMLASLEDPYTVYYSPKEFTDLKQETSGSYSGVGMVLMMNDRLPTVVSVFEGSPGCRGGDSAPGTSSSRWVGPPPRGALWMRWYRT